MTKWTTIKILSQLKNEINPIIESGKFHSVSDFVSYVARNEIKKQREVQFSRPDLSLKTSRDEGNDRG